MTGLTPLFVLFALLAALLATISLWAPRRAAVKGGALVLVFAVMGTGYAALADLLGRPKPVRFAWWEDRAAEATVLGNSMVEGEAIYLWLQLDGRPEPRAYALPWDRRTAEQLQEAARAAGARGTGLRLRLPFESSLDDQEPRFYALPQPALPPKDGGRTPPPLVLPGSDA